MAIINGRNYDWSSVDIRLPGINIEVQEIDYDDEQDKEASYGKGNAPRGFGTGNYKSSGKLSLLRDDYNDLLDYCKKHNISFYDLIIDKIVVSYANSGQRTRQDVLNTVTFNKRSHKAAQGDKSLKIDLDMLIVNGIVQDGVKPV
ncbi:hypothetical protein [Caproicibacter sp.]|uniref:hypothetical protein n=1 Tax=Caproicibacter sp. TaxID=2814884 RepID=UPI00398A3773